MGGSQKSKRVSWASDVNLCQVKLFLSDDTPSQVRIGTQDHLQAKPLASGRGMGSDDNLPPGFEGAQPTNPWTARLSQIPLIKWKRPLMFQLNIDWQVVAGEESREVEIQNQREMRVLEAIYPRPSAIPPNPCELANVEGPNNSDQQIPVVPITPIEDEDAAIDFTYYDTHNTPKPPNTNTMIISQQHPQQLSHDIISRQPNNGLLVEPEIVAAAQAALTSVSGQANNKNNNNNMIDSGLLVKILNDPKMIEQLMSNRNVSSSSSSSSAFHSTPTVGSRFALSSASSSSSMQHNPPSTSSSPHYIPSPRPPQQQNNPFVNRRDPLPSHASAPRPMNPQPGPFYPPRNINMHPTLPPHLPDPMPVPGQSLGAPPPVTKDVNYFKSLIQQHGGERRDSGPAQFGHPAKSSQEHHHMNSKTMMKQREMPKPKIMKPCIYFNSPKGCRNGPDCSFQHEIVSSAQQRVGSGIPEVQSTKRAKLDGEIPRF